MPTSYHITYCASLRSRVWLPIAWSRALQAGLYLLVRALGLAGVGTMLACLGALLAVAGHEALPTLRTPAAVETRIQTVVETARLAMPIHSESLDSRCPGTCDRITTRIRKPSFRSGNFRPGNFRPGNFRPGNFRPGNFRPGNFRPGALARNYGFAPNGASRPKPR